MKAEEILKIEKCGDLFTNDIDKCKEEYKHFLNIFLKSVLYR